MDDVEFARYAVRTFSWDPVWRKFHSLAVSGDHWNGGVCTAHCYKAEHRHFYVGKSDITALPTVLETHTAPNLGCVCGIYGALYLDCLAKQYETPTTRMVAVIAAEGVTLVGSRGLRTQYARVVAYFISGQWSDLYKHAERQFLGAKRFSDCFEMLGQYNIPLFPPDVTTYEQTNATWWKSGERRA